MQSPGLIEHQRITTIVDNVTQARTDIQHAFALLHEAKARLKAVYGEHYGSILWDQPISEYDLLRTQTEVDAFVERRAWQYVITQTGMQSFMTERRQKELQEQLTKNQFPALTVAHVLSTLQGFTGQIGTLLQESAQEVFAWLTPPAHWRRGQYKTNKQFRIGPKVIVSGIETRYGGGYRLNYYRQANFRALGNVSSLLDGQGAQKYPDDLCTQLDAALQQARSGQEIRTPYLTLKPYANGNAHLRFLRPDLMDKLNHLGGDGTLGQEERSRRPAPGPQTTAKPQGVPPSPTVQAVAEALRQLADPLP
jgi:hypothetical protein